MIAEVDRKLFFDSASVIYLPLVSSSFLLNYFDKRILLTPTESL